MKPVTTRAVLQDAVRRVPRSGAEYASNFFASPEEVDLWIASQKLFLIESEQAVLIVRDEGNFHRLYHVATNAAALAVALRCLAPTRAEMNMVTDVIGEPESIAGTVEVLAQNGFTAYVRLLRMARVVQTATVQHQQTDPAEIAGRGDVQGIKKFFDEHLDPISEQIPGIDQLQDAVTKGAVLIVRQASTLAGVLIYDRTGFTTILRYWHVGRHFRHRGVGSRLIRTFFDACRASKRILLWVIEGNENAIAKYRYYGFHFD